MRTTVGDLRERAGRVLSICDLYEIRLVQSESRSAHPALTGTFDVETDVQFKAEHRPRDQQLDVFAQYSVTATSADDPEVEAWQVRLELVAIYRKNGDVPIADEDGTAFAAIIGMVHIHPYARENVQSFVQRHGYAPFTMDMLQPISALPDDHEIDFGS